MMKMNPLPASIKRFLSVLLTASLLFFVISYLYYRTNTPVSVTFVDVGQGDACLVQAGKNGNVLIDGGDKGSGSTLQSFLATQNVRVLDAIFVSHFHDDHMSGVMELLQSNFSVKMVYLPQFSSGSNAETELVRLIHEKQIPFCRLKKGDSCTIGKATYHVLWPAPKADYMKENNQSLVLRMDYGENRVLFPGDIEFSAQIELSTEQPDEIQAEILKVPHHGGETAVLIPFLEACNPQISVIGVGMNNLHGHPSQEMLDALNQLQSTIYRTDLHGNVKVILNEATINRVEISTAKWRILPSFPFS